MNVLDAGTKFFGTIEILNFNDKVLNLMALAMKNLKFAGKKRNRGFGRINCPANFGIDIEKFLGKEA